MPRNRAFLHILTEYSQYSMGFVLITPKNRAVIIDGGRPMELPNVAAHVGDRPVAAWFLTHPHSDHITCINHAIKHDHPLIAATERFIYRFPAPEFCTSRLTEGECTPEAGMIFSDVAAALERVADHAVNIASYITKRDAII